MGRQSRRRGDKRAHPPGRARVVTTVPALLKFLTNDVPGKVPSRVYAAALRVLHRKDKEGKDADAYTLTEYIGLVGGPAWRAWIRRSHVVSPVGLAEMVVAKARTTGVEA